MAKSARKPKPLPVNTLTEGTAELIPQPHGGALLAGGVKGNKGGGDHPKAFKDFMRDEIRNGFKSRHALVEASQDHTSKAFATAWKVATEYDDEKPAEKRQIVGPIEVRVRIVAEGRKLTSG